MGVLKQRTVPLAEAKAKLSELIREVEGGTEIEITKGGKRVARLLPVQKAAVPLFGFVAGVTAHDDLIAPPLSIAEWGDLA